MLAFLMDDDEDEDQDEGEWVEVMRKHRVLAGRLEAMASGSGGGGKVAEKGG